MRHHSDLQTTATPQPKVRSGGATERTNRNSLGALGVSVRGAFGAIKNFSGVPHLCTLHNPLWWVDLMEMDEVQFTAPAG